MQRYILLLRSTPPVNQPEMSPAEMQAIFEKFNQWRASLESRNPEGQKLRDHAGRVMRIQEGKLVVTDGPFAETRELVGGYFAYDAENFEEAVELAKDCPVLAWGAVEIREIERLPRP